MLKKRRWQLVISCLFTAIVTALIIFGTEIFLIKGATGSTFDTLRFLRAMHLLKTQYNGEINYHQLWDGAINGMVESVGDPYTVYLNQEDFKKITEVTEGSFGGIGIVFGKRGDDYVVISALPDNPGAAAGIKSGDIIVAIDKESTRDLNMEKIAHKIRGNVDTSVELEIKDKSGSVRTVSLVRKEIKISSVGGQLDTDSKIGYIRIVSFNERTGKDFAEKYYELEKQGMKALVLDLRGNPGGILGSCIEVAQMLVPKGPIVSIEYSNGSKQVEYSSLAKLKYPLAVLIDNGSASASEIVAGAIKDSSAGKLFGVKTFGKGSVQSIFSLYGDTAVKVTVAKYYTPAGISINGIGITPDVEVELKDTDIVDKQFLCAKEYLVKELEKMDQ